MVCDIPDLLDFLDLHIGTEGSLESGQSVLRVLKTLQITTKSLEKYPPEPHLRKIFGQNTRVLKNKNMLQ